MKNQLVVSDYQGFAVSFTEDGWFNATDVAGRFGKRPVDWLRLPETERYIDALCRRCDVRKSHFTLTRKGNSAKFKQGTWLHPKLAVRFAQWLDIDFAIWCDEQIDALLRGTHPYHDWKRQRHLSVASHKMLTHALTGYLERQGKVPERHHYINESRLICWVLTGSYGKLDREALSLSELDMLAQLEMFDVLLLSEMRDYNERRDALVGYAQRLRAGERRLPLVAGLVARESVGQMTPQF